MAAPSTSTFDPIEFLAKAGLARQILEIKNKQRLFAQGDPADSAYYLQKGRVKLSVLSARGKEAVLALLNPGEFLGEDSIPAPNALRVTTATAITHCTVLKIGRKEMVRIIHEEHAFSDLFVGGPTFQFKREAPRPCPVVARPVWQERKARNHNPKDKPGNTGRNDRYYALACKFLYESISEARIHQVQR